MLFSSTDDNDNEGEHVGQYRIKFHYNECGEATIMAQQIQDDEGVYTFRKWNPDKKNVPFGTSTDAEQDTVCSPMCCYICMCVNCLMNSLFEEVVDHAKDGSTTSEDYFKGKESDLGSSAKILRVVGICLTILGHYLLFSPVIKTLNMIPFVGWLLSGVVAIAAIIFAVVVGLTLSILTIAIAWVFFRPLIGVPLLILVGVSIYLTFFYDWNNGAVVGEDTTPTDTSGDTTVDTTGDTTGGDPVAT